LIGENSATEVVSMRGSQNNVNTKRTIDMCYLLVFLIVFAATVKATENIYVTTLADADVTLTMVFRLP
jgi:hypothetical protein